MAEIDGATAEQPALLEELLAGMPSTRLEAFRIEPWDPMDWDKLASLGIASRDPRFAEPTGVALVVTRPVDVGVRGECENELLALAFRDRSANAGLPSVLAAGHPHARGSLEWSQSKTPLRDGDPLRIEAALREAVDAADARVALFEILRVAGHALAATIEVDEPHSFVRYRLGPLSRRLHRPSNRSQVTTSRCATASPSSSTCARASPTAARVAHAATSPAATRSTGRR